MSVLDPRPPEERIRTAVAEAAKSFERGDTKMGIVSLSHALRIALSLEPSFGELEARRLYQSIEKAARVWDQS